MRKIKIDPTYKNIKEFSVVIMVAVFGAIIVLGGLVAFARWLM